MIEVKLSPRLMAIVNMIPIGAAVADIGTDHGRLPLFLVGQGIAPFAIASDRIRIPIAELKEQVAEMGLADKISVRLGDGLQVLQPGEADTIILSGMGGMTMIDIFERAPQVVASAGCLVVQPQRSIPLVRQWLAAHHWRIIREDVVLDDGRYYEVICAEQGRMTLTEREAEFGPVLLEEKPLLLEDYLLARKEDGERLLRTLGRTEEPTPLTIEKINQVKKQIAEIEEVLKCL